MVQSQFALTWDGYQSNICNGFTGLQQNGEFVDMTLAADGHLVKVHQMLIALASPYLKELIKSAPCPHPVIFLNSISHEILCNILEYIYTGEVLVKAENLATFFEAAKALHISGLNDLVKGDALMDSIRGMQQQDKPTTCHVSGMQKVLIPNVSERVSLPATATKIHIKQDNPKKIAGERVTRSSSLANNSFVIATPMPQISTIETVPHQTAKMPYDTDEDENVVSTLNNDKPQSNLQFTVSTRGSLQVILNRYIYNAHSTAQRRNVRRWRCVDYRNNRCMAFIITKGNMVLNRANLHNHPFHDKKILSKIEKNAVYSAIEEVEGLKDVHNERTADTDEPMPTSEEYNVSTDNFNSTASDKQIRHADMPEV